MGRSIGRALSPKRFPLNLKNDCTRRLCGLAVLTNLEEPNNREASLTYPLTCSTL
jgi:hypothetical protein